MRHKHFTTCGDLAIGRLAASVGRTGAVVALLLLVTLVVARAQDRRDDAGAIGSAAALGAPAAAGTASLAGQWSLRGASRDGLQFMFRYDGGSTSTAIPLSDFHGLPAGHVAAPDSTVRFELPRDAGTVRLEGRVHTGNGFGTFTFTADQDFRDALRALGYPMLTDADAFRAAILDASLDFVRDLHAQAVQPGTINRLISLRIHQITGEYVRQLRALGYPAIAPETLISMQIHGVTPAFIAALHATGYHSLSPEELVSLCIHGVTPTFVRELQAIGYRQIPVDDLVSLRVHRVTLADIRQLAIARREPPPIADVIHAKIAR